MSSHKKAMDGIRRDFYSSGPVNDTAAYTFEGLMEYSNSLHADHELLRAELAKAHHAAAEACAKEMDRMESNLRLGAGPDGWASNEYTADAMRWEAVGYMRAAGLLRDGAWRKHMEAREAAE